MEGWSTMTLAERVIARSEKTRDGRRTLEVIRSADGRWTMRQITAYDEDQYETILDGATEGEMRLLLLDLEDALDEIGA
jgi:hypothetical protein